MIPTTSPAASAFWVEAPKPNVSCRTTGRDEAEGEEAEDDGRDADQDLEDRLDDLPDPRGRVLGEVDRRAEAERDRDEDRDTRDQQGPVDQRPDAVLRVREGRRPLAVGDEPGDPDVAEELDRLAQKGVEDPDRRQDRDRRRGEEAVPDRLFAPAGPADAEGLSPRRRAGYRMCSCFQLLSSRRWTNHRHTNVRP